MAESCANPLFLSWLKELWDMAKLRNTKADTSYARAYHSLQIYPCRLDHPSEAQALKGIGPSMVEKLTERMEQYCREQGIPMPPKPRSRKRTATAATETSVTTSVASTSEVEQVKPARRKKATVKEYVPKYKSGAYGLVYGLGISLRKGSDEGLTKSELIAAAQPFSNASYTTPQSGTLHYTAWNSMKSLLENEVVREGGRRPAVWYTLTEKGWRTFEAMRAADPDASVQQNVRPVTESDGETPAEFARRLSGREDDARGPKDTFGDSIGGAVASLASDDHVGGATTDSYQTVLLPPDSFTVELVIDHRERGMHNDRSFFQRGLQEQGVLASLRSLSLGDFVWIAKLKDPKFLQKYGDEGDEVMLNHIVERKRKDDLVESIKSGRFVEQKFRLSRSGIQNVVYVVADSGLSDMNQQAYAEHMKSAVAKTLVSDKFFVRETADMDATVKYLAKMTHKLREMFTGAEPTRSLYYVPTSQIHGVQGYQDLVSHFRAKAESRNTYSVTFPTFAVLSSKSGLLTLRDVFLRTLMCTRGVSAEKALAIQAIWHTPSEFINALEKEMNRGGMDAAESMVSNMLGNAVGPRKIGKALSKKIATVWLLDGRAEDFM